MANDILRNRDILVVGQQPWDVEIGSNCKNLALEFSKHNRILYVNSALDRITLLRHKNEPRVQHRLEVVRGRKNGLMLIQDNLWTLYPDKIIESVNWIKNRPLFNTFNRINNNRFAGSIRKAADQLGFRDIILFNDNDMFRSFYLKELLEPDLSIYYSRDYMLSTGYWKFHGSALEPRLIEKSDLCMANSTYLANYCRKYNPRSYYVGQGCELTHFTNTQHLELPSQMRGILRPIIGYVGALENTRLDIPLLRYIAEQRPDWNIVLVGKEDESFRRSDLHQFSNIHFLGLQPVESLPSFINAFDVCLNPQLVNQTTIGNYPRKIDEYLSIGKPVVATRTEAMSLFAAHTYLADTHQNYIEQICCALSEDSSTLAAERRAFASTHTWENNVKEIYKAINGLQEHSAAACLAA